MTSTLVECLYVSTIISNNTYLDTYFVSYLDGLGNLRILLNKKTSSIQNSSRKIIIFINLLLVILFYNLIFV